MFLRPIWTKKSGRAPCCRAADRPRRASASTPVPPTWANARPLKTTPSPSAAPASHEGAYPCFFVPNPRGNEREGARPCFSVRPSPMNRESSGGKDCVARDAPAKNGTWDLRRQRIAGCIAKKRDLGPPASGTRRGRPPRFPAAKRKTPGRGNRDGRVTAVPAPNRLTPEVPSPENAQRAPGNDDAGGPKSDFLHAHPGNGRGSRLIRSAVGYAEPRGR